MAADRSPRDGCHPALAVEAQVALTLRTLGGVSTDEIARAFLVPGTHDGAAAGLGIVDRLGLDDFRYLHSTRAELLRRLGRTDEARDAYRRARQLTDDGAERRFLERRLTELASTAAAGDVVTAQRSRPSGSASCRDGRE